MGKSKRNYPAYNARLRSLARGLRQNGTLGEVLLWKAIKGKALGVEFHRQVPIGNYIVDFYCHERNLAVELDGSSHDHEENFRRDVQRQAKLEASGVQVLRFREVEARDNLVGIVDAIRDWLESN